MNKLDYRYFETLTSKVVDGYKYEVIAPKSNPMILFSNEGTPLAAVELRSNVPSLITKRYSGETDFQGIISEDNQEFNLVITNLTNIGEIKIDFMHNSDKVVDVDPGAAKGGVNQVNELHPLQSYVIKCDQRDNKQFILSKIKTVNNNNLTVQEDESNDNIGAKYWISVVPDKHNDILTSLFEFGTFWQTVDVFILKTKHYYSRARGGDDFISVASLGGEYREYPSQVRSMNMEGLISKGLVQQSGEINMDDIVNNSSAAKVTGGSHVTVNSGYTGKGYAYDLHSPKCILGLSVAEGLVFNSPPSKEELIELGNTLIEHYTSDKLQYYITQLTTIYKSDECVLCLEETPNSVFYSCGHQCCHYSCIDDKLKNCPLCRRFVIATIKV